MAIFGGSVITNQAGVYTYPINQSLRFEDGSSAYLNRTPATTSASLNYTFSCWVKRGNITGDFTILSGGDGSANNDQLVFYANDTIRWRQERSSTLRADILTVPLFRDPSAWYHIVFSYNDDAATDNEIVKIYVNGEEQSLTIYNSADSGRTPAFLTTYESWIGRDKNSSAEYFDGYMAEVHLIDGQALGPEYFGETDDTWGIWKPKAYEGTYGTNGFYLDFSNSADLGEDSSGNSNDWTANSLAATDVMLDTPTNNWCIISSVDKAASATLSEGNTKAVITTSGSRSVNGSFAVNSGKWYWEINCISAAYAVLGVIKGSFSAAGIYWPYNFDDGAAFYYGYNGQTILNTVYDNYGATYGTGHIIGIALDVDSGTIEFFKDNVSQGSVTLPSNPSGYWIPSLATVGTDTFVTNFGQDSSFAGNETAQNNTDANGYGDFYYAPPSGFLALCSANLEEAAVIPSENFNTVLYTGNGSNGHAITGVGFQPDFVWGKCRNVGTDHYWVDAVRGVTNVLRSNLTNVEYTQTDSLVSFDSDGFTLDDDNSGGPSGNFNISGRTYAAWNWKADNTAGSTNTDGSITSTVAANPDAGFSIVGYTGNATAGATVGHGLSSAPEMVIVKSRTAAYNWTIYHESIGATKGLYFTTDAQVTSTGFWNDTAPTSTIVTIGNNSNVNRNLENHIAYCFHSVDGYSKIGSYTGNGSADGPFVYTGFRPAFILVKSTAGTWSWVIWDAQRNEYNVVDKLLVPNATSSEATQTNVDFTSNGFKLRTNSYVSNTSGVKFIYAAFAEAPFNYSTAR